MNKKILLLLLGIVFFILGFSYTGYSVEIDSCKGLSSNTFYEMNQSISTTSNCFDLANNVTFDCKGFTLTGDGTNSAFYNSGAGTNNIFIRNCVLDNFGNGVSFQNAGDLKIKNSLIKNSDNGLLLILGSDDNLIINNTFENNSLDIYYDSSPGNKPSNNILYMNNFNDLSKIQIDEPLFFNSDGNHFYYNSSGNLIGNFWDPINKTSCGNSTIFFPFEVCTDPGNYTIDLANNILDLAPLIDYSNKIYTCIDIIFPGSYELNNSITYDFSSGYCIKVSNDDVNLDCNNFDIISNISGTNQGIFTNFDNSNFFNCNVYNFYIGYIFFGANNGSIISSSIYNSSSYSLRIINSNNNNFNNINIYDSIDEGLAYSGSSNNNNEYINFYNSKKGFKISPNSVNTSILFSDFRNLSDIAVNSTNLTYLSGNYFKHENQFARVNWNIANMIFNSTITGHNIGNYWNDLNYTNCKDSNLIGPYEYCTDPGNYTINSSFDIYDFRPLIYDPFRITNCQDIEKSGNYFMSGNVFVSGLGVCIDVKVDDVQINCNGNVFSGVDDMTGINSFNHTNITIENCLIEDFGTGIYLNKTSVVKVKNSTLKSNGFGFLSFISNNVLINHTHFITNSDSSITLVNITSSEFSRNHFQDNHFDIIFVNSSDNFFYLNNLSNSSQIIYNDYLTHENFFSYEIKSGLFVGNYWNDLNCKSSFPYEEYFFCEKPYYYSIEGDKIIADVAPLVTSLILEDRNYSMRLYENSMLDFFVFQTRKNYTLRSDYTKENILNHLVLTYNGTDYNIFLNGKLVRTVNTSSPDFLKYDRVVIGGKENDFKGIIDEVKIYSRVIDNQEIQNNYYNYESNSKGCCNYLTFVNPNLMGYNTTFFNDNVSYSSNVFFDRYGGLAIKHNLTLFEIQNITSSNTDEEYYNFLVDACMISAYSVSDFGDLTKILTLRKTGEYDFSCSNLVSSGIY